MARRRFTKVATTEKQQGFQACPFGEIRKAKEKHPAVSVTDKQIRIGTDVPYAQVHNEGGNGTITQNVRSHSRREHSRKACYRNGRKVSACRVKQHTVRPYSRQVQVNIPKRQFMGPSKALNKRWKESLPGN